MRADDMIGQLLGHYRIIRPLGYGGTATVFLAQDIHLQREVAVKVYQPGEDDTKDFLRRFAREARVLAQLDHPNILPVYEYGEQGSLAYLVMPHMAGGSLREHLRSQGTLPAQEAVRLMAQILNALQYAHDRGLIHRDIKPGNMLFKADGTMVLSDFGLVKVLAPIGDMSQTGDGSSIASMTIAGTPDYMAPEQIMGKVSPVSDIYGVGAALYEMLTGTRLFTADNYIGMLMKHLHEQPRPLRELNPRIPPALEAVLMHSLAKDPDQRYQRPLDFLQALNQALAPTRTNTPIEQEPTIVTEWQAANPPQSYVPPNSGTPSSSASNTPGLVIKAQNATPITPSAPTQRDALGGRYPATPSQPPSIYNAQSPYATQPQEAYSPTPASSQAVTPARPQQKLPPIALIATLAGVIVLLLASLGTALFAPQVFGIRRGSGTPTSGPVTQTSVSKATQTVTTANVPATTTACPTTGTARAATLAPLALGNNQNLLYIVNEGTFTNPTFGTVKRRDITATMGDPNTKGVEISKMANTYVSEAQVGQDGRWVLFTVKTAGQYQLRMVRVDGQGLQTLYCAPTRGVIGNTQWSYDQKFAVFTLTTTAATVYLLNLTNGQVQPEVLPETNKGYIARTWLDNNRIYLVSITPNANAPATGIYVLDIRKGANQHSSDLQPIVTSSQLCTSFDTNYTSTQLIISTCTTPQAAGPGAAAGPSTVTVQPATGGTAKTILTDAKDAIVTLRTISQTTVLVLIQNTSADRGRNGLWKVNADGSNPSQLSTDANNTQSLCRFSQYTWSNISLDGKLYAFEGYDPTTQVYSLAFGPLDGSAQPTEFASIKGTQLFTAGWTTL